MPIALRSHAHIAPFRLHRPTTVAEAKAMKQAMPEAQFMAGGIELIGRMKWGEEVGDVIHLARVAGLAEISASDGSLRIGAGATHAAIAESPVVSAMLPDLALLWPQVANPRIRFTGTLGGNLMCGQPGYDGWPAMLALGAHPEGQGLLEAVTIPAGTTLLADRSLKPALVVWLGVAHAQGRVTAARLGIGGAHTAAVLLEPPVDGTLPAAEEAGAWATEHLPEPITDSLASATYRRRMVGVLARRLLIRAGGRA